MTAYFACDTCGSHYISFGRDGMPCDLPRCTGTVVDVTAAIARLAPTYDPAWWIVTTGDNVLRPRWEMPAP